METESEPGKTWTLVFGLTLLLVTFGLAYAYVLPRLGCELISRTASLEFHPSATAPTDGWSPMTLPNGSVRHVSPETAWGVDEFSAFQHVFSDSPRQVVLLLSDAGRQREQNSDATFVVILHDQPIAEVRSEDWTATQVTLRLEGMSAADANEAMARLTE
ncbi:MAG: hypothetical protein R3C59_18875 [Planctomycetaceae bacterium]